MRWLGRLFLALLAVVALAVPALWIGRDVVPPRLLRWAINHAAGQEVIDDLAFRFEGLSLAHVAVADLVVNTDRALTAEAVRVEFDPGELLRGRLRALTLTGAALDVAVGPDGGIGFGSLDAAVAAFSPDAAAGPEQEPFIRRLELQDARLRLTGILEGSLHLEGTVAPSAAGVTATLPWRLDATSAASGPLGPGLAVTADGRVGIDRRDGGVRANLAIGGGTISRGKLDVGGVRGTAALVLPAAGPTEVMAELSATAAAAGDAILPTPYLHLRADPSGLSVTARLGPAGDPAVEIAAAADAATDGGRPFRIDSWGDLAWLDTLLAAWIDRPVMATRGTVHAEMTGRLPAGLAAPAVLWDGAVAAGGVTVIVAGTRLPEPATGTAFGTARLAVALAAGRLAIDTMAPATVDAALEAPLPGPAGAVLGSGRIQVELGSSQVPLRALLTAPFGDASLDLAGPVRLTIGAGAAAADGGGRLVRGDDGWVLQRVERLAVTAGGFGGSAIDLHELDARLEDLELTPDGPRGDFAVDLKASAVGHGVTNAAVSLAGRVASDAAGSRLLLSAPGRLSVRRLAPSPGLAPLEGLVVRLAAGDQPVATRPAAGGAVSIRLPLELPALRLASARPGAWGLALQPMRLTAEATLDPEAGSGQLRARLAGGSAEVTPTGVTLEGLAADLRADLGADGVRLQRVDLRASRVADKARLARFTPLSLEGSARGAGTAASPDRLAFRMTLRGADGAFVLDADGHHLPAAGRGEARVKLFPIRFVPGGLQPADLSPAAAAMFRDASGEVSLAGRVRWPGEAVPPDDPLTLVLADLGFSGSLGTVTGLAGSVALTHLDPLTTAPGQTVSAKAVDVGIPIVAPRIRFRLEPPGILRLETVAASFADGRVTAADVAIPLDGKRPVPVVLTVEGVDAARLAEAVGLEGLAATGTLSGWLPLLWDPETGLAVRQARLTADTGGGTLHYRPDPGAPALQDPSPQVSLLLDAIRNFVYESFEVEADGRPGEPFDVKLRLRGANPDLYDGHPIALNVTLTGALDQLFANLRRSLGLTDVIQRRLQATTGNGG